MLRKFLISNRLPNRYFQKLSLGAPDKMAAAWQRSIRRIVVNLECDYWRYVHPISDSFCADAKPRSDGASVYTWWRWFRCDFCDEAKLCRYADDKNEQRRNRSKVYSFKTHGKYSMRTVEGPSRSCCLKDSLSSGMFQSWKLLPNVQKLLRN